MLATGMLGMPTGYGATKAAMNFLTESLAKHVKKYNIAVDALNPGPIKSEGAAYAMPDKDWTGWHEPEFVGPPSIFGESGRERFHRPRRQCGRVRQDVGRRTVKNVKRKA